MEPGDTGSMRAQLLTLSVLFSSYAGASCVPVAPWSGLLIPPTEDSRKADGSIEVKLENTPKKYANLRGKTLRLRQIGAGKDLRFDVSFGPGAQHWIKKDQLIVAHGLDGWKKVSALESLAHSRPNDVIRASLPGALLSGDESELLISGEPVLLDGIERCLVKFLSVNGDLAEIEHHSGQKESVRLDFKRDLPISPDQKITLAGIEDHEINHTGWDAFGHREDGTLVIEAISPYELHRVGRAPGERFRRLSDSWKLDDGDKTQARQIHYLAESGPSDRKITLGEKFLLVHTFGSYNDQGTTLGKFRGHSGLGFAEVKSHPITQELYFDVIYKQVYGQSRQGVFAASYHSHAYNGNLYRGRTFVRPTNDVLYPVSGMGEGFLEKLERAFDDMAAGYRTGFGHGMARVTLMTSCVHDSAIVLIDVLKGTPKTSLNRRMSRALGKKIAPDEKFRNVELLPDDIDMKLSTLWNGRRNLNLTIPRNFQDSLLKAFVDDGKNPVVILKTVQVGDDLPAISPKAPDRINTFTGTLIQHFWNQLFDN